MKLFFVDKFNQGISSLRKTMSLNCQEYSKFIKKWSKKNEITPHRKTRGSNINQAISIDTVFFLKMIILIYVYLYIVLCSGKDVPPLPPILLIALFLTKYTHSTPTFSSVWCADQRALRLPASRRLDLISLTLCLCWGETLEGLRTYRDPPHIRGICPGKIPAWT